MEVLIGGIIIVLGVTALFIVLYFISQYAKAHKLVVKEPTQNGFIVKFYSMVEKKDRKTGIITWASLNNKIKIPEPPSESVNIMKKGKKYCQVYRISEDEYIFAQDRGVDEIALKGLGFKPFSVVQRQVIVSQFAKAEEMRNKSWIKENLVPAASILGLVVIISMLFVFWGDIAKPALDSHALALETQQQNIKILHQLGIKTGNDIGQDVPIEKDEPLIPGLSEVLPDGG
jgi:hypothetical protein|tara:strand:+ start:374 stop:1063 length:690 start_codon:yes stop_codon:yes gene_type:complete